MNPIRNADSSNGARKIIFAISTVALFLGFAPETFAQGFVPLAGIPGLTAEGVNTTASGLPAFFNNLYKYLIGLAAALAVIEIIWGGLEYSTQDSPGGKSGGKERIYQAIFGLVLVLSPVLVFSIINPSILNLSLNLPPLETKSSPPVQTESRTLPPCSPSLKKNCSPEKINVVEGYYMEPPSGSVCVKLIKPAPESYFCTSTMDRCSLNTGKSGSVGSVITTIGADNIVDGSNGCRQY